MLATKNIRWWIRRDMAQVLAIEQVVYGKAGDTEKTFCELLGHRHCIGMVYEQEEGVTGYMIYELHKSKLHIVKFVVHPEWRERGIGEAMLMKLKNKLSAHRRTHITVEISENNKVGLAFLKKNGFFAHSVDDSCSSVFPEDVYMMVYQLKGGFSE